MGSVGLEFCRFWVPGSLWFSLFSRGGMWALNSFPQTVPQRLLWELGEGEDESSGSHPVLSVTPNSLPGFI